MGPGLISQVALVHGRPDAEGEFDGEVLGQDGKMKEALTHYKRGREWAVTEERGTKGGESSSVISEVALFPKTGRKHQLRVHLSGAGTPIVGDQRYCPQQVARRHVDCGMFLWARRLHLQHPISREKLSFEKNPPETFQTYPASLAAEGKEKNKA